MIFSHVLYQLSYPATVTDRPTLRIHRPARCNTIILLHPAYAVAIREAGATGLEPATSGVTGRRSNQLNYAPATKLRDYLTSWTPRKWAQQDLNLRPPACKAGALPLSYAPRHVIDSRHPWEMPPGEFESPPSP